MKVKTIVRTSVVAIVIGIIFTGIGYAINGSFSLSNSLNYNRISQNSKTISKSEEVKQFNNIDIDVAVNDVKIIPSDKYKIEVRYKIDKSYINYRVENNTLIIEENIKKNNNYNFKKESKNYINVYIPKNTSIDDVKIVSDIANLSLNDMIANQLDITCNVGNIQSRDCSIENVKIETDTGNIEINNLETNFAETYSNLGNIVIKNSTINKKFDASNDLGNIDINGKLYGKSNITTDLGNIELSIDENRNLYNYNIKNDLGVFKLDGQKYNKHLNINNNCENDISIECGTGKVELNFK